jgi:hypothetical protein
LRKEAVLEKEGGAGRRRRNKKARRGKQGEKSKAAGSKDAEKKTKVSQM